MAGHLRRGVFGLVLALTAVACASTADDADVTTAAATSEVNATALRLSTTQYLGKLGNGESRSARYTARPSFQSYGFEAKGGDTVTARVAAAGGGAFAWITDEELHILAASDARAPSGDAVVTYVVPAALTSQAYRLVFRERDRKPTQIEARLSIAVADGVCAYNGQAYNPGDTFDSVDGCNSCTCDASGAVTCSKQVCDCNPANEPWRTYYGTPTQCIQLLYECPRGEHSFANSCGCGCERPH